MTAHSSIDEAVELLKLGAADYIPKPISPEVLNHRLDTILENLTLTAELADFKLKDIKTATLESLIGSAPFSLPCSKDSPRCTNRCSHPCLRRIWNG